MHFNLIESHTEEITFLRAESISKDVKLIFENARVMTEQMSLHPEIKRYLKEVEDYDDIRNHPDYLMVLDTLYAIRESNELHEYAWIANEQANFYLDNDGTIPEEGIYDVQKRPWYKDAVGTEKVAFTLPYVEWISGNMVMSSIKALRDYDGIYGFVSVDINLDDLPLIFGTKKINPNDKNFLVNDEGMYIYHADQSKNIGR